MSRASTRPTVSPRLAASSAAPAPTTPAPITRTSNSVVARSLSAWARLAGLSAVEVKLIGSGTPSYSGVVAASELSRACGAEPRSPPSCRHAAGDQGGAVGIVLGLNEADRPGARPHGQRPGADPAGVEADTLEQATIGDAGRGKEDVLPADQVPGGQDLVQVVSLVDRVLTFLVVARGQPGEDLPAKAAQRGRGDHPFRGTAGAQQQIDAGVDLLDGRGLDRAGHVAVGQELDPRAGAADRGHQ